jgi:hypothetical protein
VVLGVPSRSDHGQYLGMNVFLPDGLPKQHPGGGRKRPAVELVAVRTRALAICSPAARCAALSFRFGSGHDRRHTGIIAADQS